MATNELRVNVRADTQQAQKGLAGLKQRMEGLTQKSRTAGLALSGMGAAGVLAIKSFASAAIEQERIVATLGQTIENTGANFEDHKQKILDATAALQAKTNFGDEQQMKALALMVPILGDVDKAMAALPLVLDASATSGKSLETVTGTLSRALSGQVNQAISIGVNFDKNATFAERLALGFSKVGGAAEANVDPFQQMSNDLGDLKEKIGMALMPALTVIIDKMRAVAARLMEWIDKYPQVAKVIGIAIVALTGIALVLGPLLLMLPAIIAGVTALGAAFTLMMGPLGLVVLAIVAFAAAYKTNFLGIRDITDKVVKFIKDNWRDMIQGVVDHFQGFVNKFIDGINIIIKGLNVFRAATKQDLIPELEHLNIQLFKEPKKIASGIHSMATEMTEAAEATAEAVVVTTKLVEVEKELAQVLHTDMVDAMEEAEAASSMWGKGFVKTQEARVRSAEIAKEKLKEVGDEEVENVKNTEGQKTAEVRSGATARLNLQMEAINASMAATDASAAGRHDVIGRSSGAFMTIPGGPTFGGLQQGFLQSGKTAEEWRLYLDMEMRSQQRGDPGLPGQYGQEVLTSDIIEDKVAVYADRVKDLNNDF
jgi:hypothetical protein